MKIINIVLEVHGFEVPRFAMQLVEPLAVSFRPSAKRKPAAGGTAAGRRQDRDEVIVDDLGVAPRRRDRRDR